MARTTKSKSELTGKAPLRSEIVEMTRDQHALGMVSDAELGRVTMRMLGADALPKVLRSSPAEIAKVREQAGVSQAVLAGILNVTPHTVSQWECGERRPTGTALKLLHVVRNRGLDVLH